MAVSEVSAGGGDTMLMGLQGHTGSGQPQRGCPLALLMVGALTEAWPRAVWMVQPPAETA